jgi:AcrR family transcriptional regulator
MVRHYFGSKAGLIEACHLFAVARFEQVARQFVQVLVRADVGARRSGLVALAEQVREQPEPLALWCRDFGGRRRGADEPSMSQACATWATALEDRFERPSGSLPVRLWLVLGLFIRGATVDSPTLMDLTDAGRSQLDGQLADACLIALGLADGADRA